MMPAGDDNPRGFFERLDVTDLNERLLATAGGSWCRPPAEAIPQDDESIRGVIARLEQQRPWLLKDPRMVLTWSAWRSVLDDCARLYVYRAPQAVANSLRRRHGFPLEYGYALWEYYNRTALEMLAAGPFTAMSYDDFAADAAGTAARLERELTEAGVALPRALDVGFFDSKLDHSQSQPLTDSRLTAEQRALHEYCVRLCRGDASAGSLPSASPALLERLDDFAAALAGLEDLATLRSRETVLTGERDAARDTLGRVSREYDTLSREHEALCQSHETALQRQADLEQETSRLGAVLNSTYGKLLEFDRSLLGRGLGLRTWLYKLLTLRPGASTAYEDILTDVKAHFGESGDLPLAGGRSRLGLGFSVLSYVLRHPVSSIRSFSWYRLRRALSVFFGSNRDDLAVWVGQRFPELDEYRLEEVSPELSQDLDSLLLEFIDCGAPKVSIVLPVYNQYRMTVYCLRSLLQHTSEVDYELILADDASTDLTATIEERVSGITVCRASENCGYLKNCNAAAAKARGDYILLLNNDTAFTPGWLESLVATLEEDESTGVVGPMLLFGNGRLQEAGGIVWDDASGWNYGRMDDPARPDYNYLKEVDYISGACLLVCRSLWESLGGYDERYVPAYYEDTDLCFAAREAGYRVLYQPRSRIYHFEGASHGTDLDAGIKQHQLENQHNFLDKWQAVLAREHAPNGEQVFLARDRSLDRRTILVIDHYVPSFDKDAGSRSTWLYLQLMVEMGYNVKFIGANFFPHQPYTRALQAIGIEVLVGEYMARNLESWLQGHADSIDTIYIHRPHVAEQFLDVLNSLRPRPRLVYFGHDLHFLRFEREFALKADPALEKEAASWKSRELALFQAVDKVYYPSQVEIDVIHQLLPDLGAEAIPLYVLDELETSTYDWSQRSDILFVAGFNHPPNIDGLIWFVEEVMPLVWRSCPELKVHVVGSNAPDAVTALAGERVVVHGYLSDRELEARYALARMVAVPLRFGAGVKGKVLEALQHGLPLVTTPIGAEGLPEADSVFNIEDDAGGFADALVELERGDRARLDLLAAYDDYLGRYFSKARASAILERDFGSPRVVRELCA